MERKQFSAATDSSCEFQAVIATLNAIDSDGDVVLPGAFGNRDGIPVIWAHDSSRIPLGSVSIREVGDEVVATGELIDGEACGWLRHAQANGVRQQWSWGFIPTSSRPGKFDGQNVRFIENLDLLEVSGVLRGASVGTRMLGVKGEKSCTCGGSCETSDRSEVSPGSKSWPSSCGYCGRCKRCREGAGIVRKELERFPDNTDRYMRSERLPWQSWVKSIAVETARGADFPIPRVRFFAETDPETWQDLGDFDDEEIELRGLFDPATNTVWLRDNLSRDQMLRTLGHELAHAHQHANRKKSSERAADKVAAKIHALYKRDVQRHETRAMRELTA